MELATGAMRTLLPKLGELLADEYKLQKSVRVDLRFLFQEMMTMEAGLRKVAMLPPGQLDEQVMLWADNVREVSFVIEDSIDRFMLSIWQQSDPGHGFRKKTIALLKKDTPHHRIGVDMKKLKDEVREVSERRDRYRIDYVHNSSAAATTVDRRMHYDMYVDPTKLVGVQEKSEELIKTRLSDGVNNQQPLKILSILGFPGVGKTTLAKVVYNGMPTPFDCKAIVSVGPDADLKRVFRDIMLQVHREKYSVASSAAMDERESIDEIRELLKHKRYFIVIDDIWDTKSWEIIRWVFIDCNCGSIVITTTRKNEVAAVAGGVYKLEPLSPHKSEELLRMSLLDRDGAFPLQQATQLIDKILQKCSGIPLAIIIVANLLYGKAEAYYWHVVSESNFWAADNRVVVEVRRIILFSYYDLPSHLRVCLLHLSIFPRNYMIRKDTLIWKWVAEGFIPESSRSGLFEMGETFFNELINRNMIQPVEISHNGHIIGCRVHDILLDIICSMAQEKNFLTLLNGKEQYAHSRYNPRRFTLHSEVVEGQHPPVDTDMSLVRSFNAIRCGTSMMPSLACFELLRVLAIEDCSSFQLEGNAYNLEYIGRLLHLRYLGLSRTHVSQLPDEVGNLKLLEILDVRQTGIRELPTSVSQLSRLKCLRADGGSTRVPEWIGNLTSLEELSLSDVSSCPNFVKEVSKLTMLRELKFWVRMLDDRLKHALVRSLSNLQKMQVLHLNGGLLIGDAEWEGYVPPRYLQSLSLRIKSLRLPRWINGSLLPGLSHLSVDLRVVEADDLAILGSLPALRTLELFIPNKVSLDVKGCDAFPMLRHCYASGMLRFLLGAAPYLESVHFNVMSAVAGASFHCGFLEELASLKQVRVEIFYSEVHGAAEVEKELQRAVGNHPNHPSLHVSQYEIVL